MKIQYVSSCVFLDATEVFDSQAMSVAAGETRSSAGDTPIRFAGDTYVLRAHPWLGAEQIMNS